MKNTRKIKNVFFIEFALLFLLVFPVLSHADTYVNSYYRSDTDSNPYNNYGFPGNFNPNTGQITPGNPDTYLSNYYGIKTTTVGGVSNAGLYKILNAGGLKTVPLPDPSEKLLKAQEDFQNKLDEERKTIDDRLYHLRLQNSTGIFASCVYPSALGCSTEGQYSSMRAGDAATGLLGTDVSNTRLSQCRSQIDAYQAAQTKYDQCISDNQNTAINDIADKAVEIAKLERESAYYKSLLEQAVQNQAICKKSHGQYSYYNGASNFCECVDGFAPDADTPYQCVPLNVWCKVESGIGATNRVDKYVDGVNKNVTCTCETNYQWDSYKNQCIAVASTDDSSLPTLKISELKAQGKTITTSSPRGTTRALNTAEYKVPVELKKKTPMPEEIAASTTGAQDATSSAPLTPRQKPSLIKKIKTLLFSWFGSLRWR